MSVRKIQLSLESVLLVATLFCGSHSEASFQKYCLMARNVLGIPNIEDRFETPEVTVSGIRTGYGSRRIIVRGLNIETLEGNEVPPSLYSFFSGQVDRLFGLRTDAGMQYSILILDKRRSLLFPITLRDYVLKFPEFFRQAGLQANERLLCLGDCNTINASLDLAASKTQPGDFQVGPRFSPHPSFLKSSQAYSRQRFFAFLLKGKILLAVKGDYGRHDQVDEHVAGALFVSDTFFKRIRTMAELLEAAYRDPVRKEAISYQEYISARDAFSTYWDAITMEIATIVDSSDSPAEKRERLRPLFEGAPPQYANGLIVYDSSRAWETITKTLRKFELIVPCHTIDADKEIDRLFKALAF